MAKEILLNDEPITVKPIKRSEKFFFEKPGTNVLWSRVGEMAEVMPHLFLSSHLPTGDEDLLQARGVTHVLSIGHLPSKTIPEIKYSYFDVKDDPKFDIKSIFKDCLRIIEEEKSEGGVVLVHCNCGVSRAPTVVIAYLMMTEKISYEDALARVKQVRAIVNPNEGFVGQLRLLEDELKNEEGVT